MRNGHIPKTGEQKYKCKVCGSEKKPDEGDPVDKTHVNGVKSSIFPRAIKEEGIDEFIKANDAQGIVSQRVEEILSSIPLGKFIFADGIYEKIGLPRGYPYLSTVLASYKEFQGFGMVDKKLRYGHPETIAKCKADNYMR